jgi:hypothetical protein
VPIIWVQTFGSNSAILLKMPKKKRFLLTMPRQPKKPTGPADSSDEEDPLCDHTHPDMFARNGKLLNCYEDNDPIVHVNPPKNTIFSKIREWTIRGRIPLLANFIFSFSGCTSFHPELSKSRLPSLAFLRSRVSSMEPNNTLGARQVIAGGIRIG